MRGEIENTVPLLGYDTSTPRWGNPTRIFNYRNMWNVKAPPRCSMAAERPMHSKNGQDSTGRREIRRSGFAATKTIKYDEPNIGAIVDLRQTQLPPKGNRNRPSRDFVRSICDQNWEWNKIPYPEADVLDALSSKLFRKWHVASDMVPQSSYGEDAGNI